MNWKARTSYGARAWVAVLLSTWAAGCATSPPEETRVPVFYPSGPEMPRLQFLASYSTERDLKPPVNRFLTFLVGPPLPGTPLAKPYGMALNGGKLYACDTVRRSIAVFDLDKRRLRHWTPAGEGRLDTPINLAMDEDGPVYVADAGRGQVLTYGPDGRYLGALDRPGGMKPTDVALAGNRVYVADVLNHCVRVYDRETGEAVFTIPRDGAAEPARLFSPTNLDLHADHGLYVSDGGAFRVQQYDLDGNYLRTIGEHGDGPGQFARPKGVAVDRHGVLYVVDAAMQVVQMFDTEGRLLMYFGHPDGADPALNLPAGVHLDYEHVDRFRGLADPDFELDYLVLVSSQYGERKINIFGYGQPR